MLCERCRIREANIQYTEVINGVRTEHNFCAQCAREMDFGQYSAIFDGDFPLGKLLSGLLSAGGQDQPDSKYSQIVCPTCKTSYDEFVKNSRFGCKDCYGVFDVLMNESGSLKKMQSSDVHTGKVPGNKTGKKSARFPGIEDILKESTSDHSVSQELELWNQKLQEALQKEEYETAAQCRDKIRELKKGAADKNE